MTAHRDFLKTIGAIVSGQRGINEQSDDYVLVFRLPTPYTLKHLPQSRDVEFGTLQLTNQGEVVVEETGELVEEPETVQDQIDFLDSIQQIASQKRRELAMQANEEHGGQYINPGGQKGHLLKEYDNLLEQIESIFYRLRDQQKQN